MLIDFSQQLKSIDKKEDVTQAGKALDLRMTCTQALINTGGDEKNPPADEKVKRYNLATKIQDAKSPLNLSAEDVVLLKKRIGTMFGPLVVGQAYLMLENSPAIELLKQ